MKVILDLSERDLAFLDRYAIDQDLRSRSAVIQRAIEGLRSAWLGDAYADAWGAWSTETVGWESTVGDGLGDD